MLVWRREFVPHLWKVLGVAGFSARLRFGEPKIYPDRRVAADQTHAEITAWRQASATVVQYAEAVNDDRGLRVLCLNIRSKSSERVDSKLSYSVFRDDPIQPNSVKRP